MKQLFRFVSIACLLVYAGACKPANTDNPDPDCPSTYEFLSGGAPEGLTKAEKENVAKINGFTFKMADQIAGLVKNKSYVYSPVSISYALGMLANGAKGEALESITSVLGFGSNGLQELNEFNRDLLVLSSRAKSKDEVLEVANAIVADKSLNICERYKECVKNYYDADVIVKNFKTDDVVSFVNDWAAEKTHGRIDRVLNDLDPSCVELLMNALYFKASWRDPFYEEVTKDELFTGKHGSRRLEKMMRRQDDIAYYSSDKFSMVRLPYGYIEDYRPQDSNYSMSIILPAEGVDIDDLVAGFDSQSWSAAQSSLSSRLVDLWLPRFDIDFDQDLSDCFKNLGMTAPFAPNADFSAMSDRYLFVSLIKQVANISVDEKGTEAAAVTVIAMAESAPPGLNPPVPTPFHCDRPFLFAITEQTTGAILFMGCYK